MNFKNFIKLLRINNYIKNLIIFFPLFLNYSSWNFLNYSKLILPFIFFCILASSIYIINDIFDLESDKKHQDKKLRPIASGIINLKQATLIASLLALLSFVYFFYIQI